MSDIIVTESLKTALWQAAKAAQVQAYAPYSRFLVGAAVLDEHGRIHAGCNVENAAYPQGTCAEAGALSAMILAGCRQKLREFASPDTLIFIASPQEVRSWFTLQQLLPESFGPEHLTT